jgi:hypothetical protein
MELTQYAIAGTDYVVIGRAATRGRAFADLRDDLRRALHKVGAA